ncbi:hypothetical protein HGA92_00795 [Candidatus Gracilibacteria bacterium]|nr:hypothetical protein [Candidatus Gracilibacteria bacterium]NUJ98853.1 hypothetical protein [Candidatus Gracilibacteria bacterium]
MGKKNFKIEISLYPIDIINKAIEDFSDYDITYDNGQVFIFGENEQEQEEIFNEFMNYVLALYNESL